MLASDPGVRTGTQCAFSGTVLDFGTIASGNTVTATDVVRATVVYEGAPLSASCPAGAPVTANTWQLSVQLAAANPLNELQTMADEANSTSGLSYTAAAGAYFLPTTTAQVLSCGGESSATDYDTVMDFKTTPSDTTGHIVTVGFTPLSPN